MAGSLTGQFDGLRIFLRIMTVSIGGAFAGIIGRYRAWAAAGDSTAWSRQRPSVVGD
jgi:hypothetical protein